MYHHQKNPTRNPTFSIGGVRGVWVYIYIPTPRTTRRAFFYGRMLDQKTYACIIQPMINNLDSKRMKQTEKLGPKFRLENPTPRNIMLTAALVEKAREIGKGNLSAGVRRAVEEYDDKER